MDPRVEKLANILNEYKNAEITLDYDWDHSIFIVNNEHSSAYEKKLDKKMFKKKVNFDIGDIKAISKIKKDFLLRDSGEEGD